MYIMQNYINDYSHEIPRDSPSVIFIGKGSSGDEGIIEITDEFPIGAGKIFPCVCLFPFPLPQ